MFLDDKRLHWHYDPMKNADKRYLGFTTAIGLAIAGSASVATATAIGIGVTGLAAYGAYKGFQSLTAKPAAPQVGSADLKAAEPSYDRAAELAQKDTDKKRRGIARNQPNYTGPLGLTQIDQSNLNLKTLTGA
jgi:hypothetical protein